MKKMLRKLLAICLVLMMVCSSAMACPAGDAAQAKLNKALYVMVDAANLQVKALVKIAQTTPYNDVAWLVASTDAVVAPVFAYAKLIGAEVECVYTEYEVDGQTVLIDPLKVINVKQPLDTGLDED